MISKPRASPGLEPLKASGSPEAFCFGRGRRRWLAPLLLAFLGGCSPDRGPRPNILLISVDTLRADRLGAYGAAAVETPAIDGLARQGVRFEHAFTPVPLTLPAHWTMHTGLEPWHHGVADNGMSPDLPPGATLAEKLGAQGYDTAAFVSAFVLHSTFGLDRGFARYDDGPAADAALDQLTHATAPAGERVGRALRWLQKRDAAGSRPFFLWLHLFDPHAPYDPPVQFRARYRDRPYDGEVAFVDQQLARLLAGLDRLGVTERTLVVLTADHGESLGEHGEETHGVLLYDATLRIPLIFRYPAALPAGELRREPATLADVAPTLLALAGFDPGAVDGRDLFAEEPGGPRTLAAISEGPQRRFGWARLTALRDERWKYIASPAPELFDWQADPGELRDLRQAEPERADRMARAVRAIDRELSSRLEERADSEVSAETRANLAALGYVGDSGKARGEPADPKSALASLGELDQVYQHFAEGRLDLAERKLTALLDRPEFPAAPTLEGLARIARLRGDEKAAEAAYLRLLAVDPGNLSALAQLLLLARERNDAETALARARQLTALAPRDGGASRLLAETLAATGDGPGAEAEWRRGLVAAPRAAWLRLSFARFLAVAGRRQEARRELAPLLEREDLPEDLLEAARELEATFLSSPGGA